MSQFKVKHNSTKSNARLAALKTSHGIIQTPFFMPIATVGAVKTISTEDLKKLKAKIILSNTYHLLLRPGLDLLKKTRGLHNFMNWSGPILTDSGGFQVYSLSKIRKITDAGVIFRSHLNGQEFKLTPEKALEIQKIIGSDIAMVLDECVGYPAKRQDIEKAVERTTLWAEKSASVIERNKEIKKLTTRYKTQETRIQINSKFQNSNNQSSGGQLLVTSDLVTNSNTQLHFAINQGGIYKDLRLKSARDLVKLNFDGYAIGGLAVGEPWSKAKKVLEWVEPELPKDKPRYLMGVGYPEQIIDAVKRGVDMFDCVIPTREARHGRLYVWKNPLKKISNIKYQISGYETLNIRSSKFTADFSAVNPNSKIKELREYSRAYLRHLFKINEPLAQRLATLNNVEFYLGLMSKIREAVKNNQI